MSPMPTSVHRYARIGDLAQGVRRLIEKSMIPLAVLLAAETAVLWFTHSPGTLCFLLVSIGSMVVLAVWRGSGAGLPVVPMLAVQNLLLYALPVATANKTVLYYPESVLTDAGIEILVYSGALAGAWRMGMLSFRFSSPMCFALQGFSDDSMGRLSRLGFRLVVAATLYEVLTSARLLGFLIDMLPAGTMSIVNAVVSGVSACGFFLGAMMVGKGAMRPLPRALFWGMLWLNAYIAASGFLLSTTITLFFSVVVGLFWSSGRVPWRFITAIVVLLSFLNLGKFEMRNRYWQETSQETTVDITLDKMPGFYREWAAASYDVMIGTEDTRAAGFDTGDKFGNRGPTKKTGQSMLDRINNLQNILFVIDAIHNDHIAPLGGATYTLIPPLLIPRILWPDKPRAHEGQVLLNVHFGRQDLSSTFQTYVAWGLQAEAYGNFGPIIGVALLGTVMGLLFAWVEKYVAPKLLLSLEGFLSFTLFLGMANSFEMVASVLITSLFQAFIPIIIASRPFVERVLPDRSRSA